MGPKAALSSLKRGGNARVFPWKYKFDDIRTYELFPVNLRKRASIQAKNPLEELQVEGNI